METYAGGEEDGGEEVVVAEVLIERTEGEDECGEFKDAAHVEEGGEGVRYDEEGDERDVYCVVAAKRVIQREVRDIW